MQVWILGCNWPRPSPHHTAWCLTTWGSVSWCNRIDVSALLPACWAFQWCALGKIQKDMVERYCFSFKLDSLSPKKGLYKGNVPCYCYFIPSSHFLTTLWTVLLQNIVSFICILRLFYDLFMILLLLLKYKIYWAVLNKTWRWYEVWLHVSLSLQLNEQLNISHGVSNVVFCVNSFMWCVLIFPPPVQASEGRAASLDFSLSQPLSPPLSPHQRMTDFLWCLESALPSSTIWNRL